MNISLNSLFAPSFHRPAWDILKEKATHYWFKGGRGSTKSSFISLQIVLGIKENPEAHAVCFRKYGCDLRGSVFNQVIWAIEMLGMNQYFSATVNPMEITYRPTGQKILFKGLDDARKSKSQKAPFGYYRYVWFEELEQYDGMQEIRSICQSLMRGGEKFSYFYSYNPPQTTSNWVNFEASKPVENRIVHHSNYLSVPKHWLGEAFFIEAELLKKSNEMAYRHEYLGEVTGTGGTIFTNLVNRRITDEEVKSFTVRKKGIDWGWVDPFAYVDTNYDKARKTIYIFDELYKHGISNESAMQIIKSKGIGREKIIADCAEPKSIHEFSRNGFNIEGAVKGQGSREYGLKWLQSRAAIVIDPVRCPNVWREFSFYELEKVKGRENTPDDPMGAFKNDYPDKNNHSIDACMYAYESEMEKRGYF